MRNLLTLFNVIDQKPKSVEKSTLLNEEQAGSTGVHLEKDQVKCGHQSKGWDGKNIKIGEIMRQVT